MRELSLHLLDLLQNAVEAGATQVDVSIVEDLVEDRLTLAVSDNGRGMDAETACRAVDPFYTTRTTRHVGLGLPLLSAAAERCEGGFVIRSKPGEGTTVTATFRHGHIDRAPLGNMPDTLIAYLLSSDGITRNLLYHHRVDDRQFVLDTAAVQSELGEIPLSYPPVREWLRDYISEGEAALALPLQGGYDAKTQDD